MRLLVSVFLNVSLGWVWMWWWILMSLGVIVVMLGMMGFMVCSMVFFVGLGGVFDVYVMIKYINFFCVLEVVKLFWCILLVVVWEYFE